MLAKPELSDRLALRKWGDSLAATTRAGPRQDGNRMALPNLLKSVLGRSFARLPLGSRRAPEQSLRAEVLVDVGPVNSVSSA